MDYTYVDLINEILELLCIMVIKEYFDHKNMIDYNASRGHYNTAVWDLFDKHVIISLHGPDTNKNLKNILSGLKTPELMLDRIKYSGEELNDLIRCVTQEY